MRRLALRARGRVMTRPYELPGAGGRTRLGEDYNDQCKNRVHGVVIGDQARRPAVRVVWSECRQKS